MATTTATNVLNQAKTYLEPGDATTCKVGAVAVLGRRFVKVSTGGLGNHPVIVPTGAGERAYDIAHFDTAIGADVSVLRDNSTFEVLAGEALTSGDAVSVGAAGVAMKAVAASQSGTTPFAVTQATLVVGICTADTAISVGAPITLQL